MYNDPSRKTLQINMKRTKNTQPQNIVHNTKYCLCGGQTHNTLVKPLHHRRRQVLVTGLCLKLIKLLFNRNYLEIVREGIEAPPLLLLATPMRYTTHVV